MSDRVLITGATGLIGQRLVDSLRHDGIAIRTATRNTDAAARKLSPDAELCRWDGVKLPEAALRGCSSVVHLAGEPIFGGLLTAARRRRIHSSRVDSTRSIAEALVSAPAGDRPTTFLCSSAVGFYGSRGEEILDESSGVGAGFFADLCRQWEQATKTAAEAGVRVVSLRTGIVMSRNGGALPSMALPFRFGLGGRMGSGQQWFPWIHIDDVVALIRAILRGVEFRGPVNAVAPNPVRNGELTTALARKLRRPALLPAPAFALRAVLGELSGELLGSRRCVPRVALDQGFQFTHTRIKTALDAELA